ncbi:MAG: efflux RND transporter periplasmic adaptor subunit [Candidatus Omnitrophota bacterium]|nr:efflux RND transporter periplasmic adaptor subunit [Candidatus Omnitrophota bacterium]
MKGKNKTIFILVIIFALVAVGILLKYGQHFKVTGSIKSDKEIYYCPMHPTYVSDRPGDCPICNMKLVKRIAQSAERIASEGKETVGGRAPEGKESVGSEEKTLEEICIEHKCTMKNCPMTVKANLKPGERIICPVCGEVISTTTGKVVEIVKQSAQQASAKESTGIKKERKILYYRNPMNPEVTSPVPMKDSMGMDYIPVHEEAESESTGPTISISPEKQQLIGIKTEPVKKINLTKVIRASGKIAYDPELYVAQEEYLQALKTVNATKESVLKSVTEQSQSLLSAAEKKLLLLGMSKDEIDELAKKGAAQENLYLPSGESSVWAYVAIYEYEIGSVKIGMPVELEAVAYPGESFKGEVIAINPVLDSMTRTNQVRVQVEDPSNKLKPEMFVNARIKVDLGEKLAVSDSAVLDTGLRKIVYLSRPQDLLEARQVQLGQKAEGFYEVLGGLDEGDIVVTSGNFFIDSESKLKSALEGTGHQHGE